MKENHIEIAWAMHKFGGSFVHHLGCALLCADKNNTERIKKAFPEYWENYKKIAEERL